MMLALGVLAVSAVALGQDKPRIGPDGRPLLNKPKVDLCKDRKFHEKYGKHHYFLSWREPWNKFEDWDWFNGRNFCRERCMDLVSFETSAEYRHFAKIMHKGRKFMMLQIPIHKFHIFRQYYGLLHIRKEV